MTFDFNPATDARAVTVLLHPHPHYGGNRFHPFINGLFYRLPDVAVSTVRFDFTSADAGAAHDQVMAAIEEAAAGVPGLAVIVAGYSFGAGVAAGIGDERVVGWYLLAPAAMMLRGAAIGDDPRPKAVVVLADDQFFPPEEALDAAARWQATTVTTVPGADHFLGAAVGPIIDAAVEWIGETANSRRVRARKNR